MLNINKENKFEVQFKESFERRIGSNVRDPQKYKHLEDVAQNWIYTHRGDSLDGIIAHQKMITIIDLSDFQLQQILSNI